MHKENPLQNSGEAVKTRRQINAAAALEALANNRPYIHRRPDGMSASDWRRLKLQQKMQYAERAAGRLVWVSAPSLSALRDYLEFCGIITPRGQKRRTPTPEQKKVAEIQLMANVQGTYRKSAHQPI